MNNIWYILGAGAIGGLWALRLHEAGLPVALLGREDGERTLSIRDGEHRYTATFRVHSPENPPPSLRYLLVTTKTQDTLAALRPWLPRLDTHSDIVLLQNGLGVREEMLEAAPRLILHSGTTTDGVFRESSNLLVLAGRGETLLGTLDAAHTKRCQELADELLRHGLPLSFTPDIKTRLWQKLAINCAINPLTVHYNCRNGELLDRPEALALMESICHEVAAVMQAEGFGETGASLFGRAQQVARLTAANTSSMLADARAGRRTEIDYMNGFIVREALRMKVPAAVNEALCREITGH